MFCGKCGNRLGEGHTFCGKCGAPVPGAVQAPSKFNYVGKDTDDNVFANQKPIKNTAKTYVSPVEEIIVEVEEKEKTITSLASNSVIYGVIAFTMIISISLIILISVTF